MPYTPLDQEHQSSLYDLLKKKLPIITTADTLKNMKIGRNDPCPCGSGKKYKKCCMLKSNLSVSCEYSMTNSYFANHNSSDILNAIIALQLNPENHGKNIRIEKLMQLAVANMDKGHLSLKKETFEQILNQEFNQDHNEDLPINLFCDNIIYYGGNYRAFPGIATHSFEILDTLTEVINSNSKLLPNHFCQIVEKGVWAILLLGDAIASKANVNFIETGNQERYKLLDYSLVGKDFSLPIAFVESLLDNFGIEYSIIDEFIIQPDTTNILTDNSDENPLLYKPIVQYNDCYYFLGISNEINAINNFILKQAIAHNCITQILELFHKSIWHKIVMGCESMDWALTDILPINGTEDYNEAIFQFDTNKFAYVCYVKDLPADISIDGSNHFNSKQVGSHIATRLSKLHDDVRLSGKEYTILVFYTSVGEMISYDLSGIQNHLIINFSAFEFLSMYRTEKWNNLSLYRYARTKRNHRNQFMPLLSELDIYSIYKSKGESFYLNDDFSDSSFISSEPGIGCSLIFESKKKLNRHGTQININGIIGCVPVLQCLEYEELYKPQYNLGYYAICCDKYNVPIWVLSHQNDMYNDNPSDIINSTATAIAFWISKLYPFIYTEIINQYGSPIEIELQFDKEAFTLQSSYKVHKDSSAKPTVSKTGTKLIVNISTNVLSSFIGADNNGERNMMFAIINKLLSIPESKIRTAIDEVMPLGPAKMILLYDTSNDINADPRWIISPIYVSSATRQFVMDEVPKWMEASGHSFTGRIEPIAERVTFLNTAVNLLLGRITEEIKKYDTKALIERLITNHEALTWKRAQDMTIIPAQLYCFGDNEEKRKELSESESQLAVAGQSIRCLVELVTAIQPIGGTILPGAAEIEYLMALMNDVIDFGSISDSLYLGVSEHIIEMLPSRRYGIYQDDFSDSIKSFTSNRVNEQIANHLEGFKHRLSFIEKPEANRNDNTAYFGIKTTDIDEAFKSDWDVSFSDLSVFCHICQNICIEDGTSVIAIKEHELISRIKSLVPDMTDSTINICIEHFSLNKRASYLTAPEGYKNFEVFPWIYNREFSFLRRFIVKLVNEEGEAMCIFGFRSIELCLRQLITLMVEARLNNVGPTMKQLLGKFSLIKGKLFNEKVRSYLKTISQLWVCDYDVPILEGNTNYGDIDVLAYDTSKHILYSIECKDTNVAKNIHDMKREMDEYLGRDEKGKKHALVYKHLKRHKWLTNNTENIGKQFQLDGIKEIKSFLLTSETIPTSYLKERETPLSIFNYQELSEKGLAYFETAKIPDI